MGKRYLEIYKGGEKKMKRKNNVSKVLLTILAIMLIFANMSMVLATSYSDGQKETYTPDEFTKNPDGKTSGGEINYTGTDKVKTIGGKIVGIIQVVGTISAVAILIALGIKYMMGSAEERAEYKKTLFPYFIGAVLIFGAANLAQIVYSWASKL